jgi:hypothetical protein
MRTYRALLLLRRDPLALLPAPRRRRPDALGAVEGRAPLVVARVDDRRGRSPRAAGRRRRRAAAGGGERRRGGRRPPACAEGVHGRASASFLVAFRGEQDVADQIAGFWRDRREFVYMTKRNAMHGRVQAPTLRRVNTAAAAPCTIRRSQQAAVRHRSARLHPCVVVHVGPCPMRCRFSRRNRGPCPRALRTRPAASAPGHELWIRACTISWPSVCASHSSLHVGRGEGGRRRRRRRRGRAGSGGRGGVHGGLATRAPAGPHPRQRRPKGRPGKPGFRLCRFRL